MLTPTLFTDLLITNDNGVTDAIPGGSVTYTITASNAGDTGVSGNTVSDTFPTACMAAVNWTCAGTSTCTAAGVGTINDSVDLPAATSVT